MCLFDLLFFPQFCKSDNRSTDISNYFRESLRLRDNKSRLIKIRLTSKIVILPQRIQYFSTSCMSKWSARSDNACFDRCANESPTVCAFAQSDQSFCYSAEEAVGQSRSKERPVKTPIRRSGCTGWSVFSGMRTCHSRGHVKEEYLMTTLG